MHRSTVMTDESLAMHAEMEDVDNSESFEMQFRGQACIEDGCSGRKSIDTMFENTSQDVVNNPRGGTTPPPVDLNSWMYPHRDW